MCEKCEILAQEISVLRFHCLLSNLSLKQTAPVYRFEAIKQLNNAETKLRATEDLFKDHQSEHLDRMVGMS
jgi:hypothetical protein